MPLDHYISQVHLRKFYSPKLRELMYAIRKSDLKEFTPNSDSVCRIEDGSTNAYLREDRIIEEFLKTIEPNYNKSLDKLETGNIDQECIYTIAGFVAFVGTCSPAWMRIASAPLRDMVHNTTEILNDKGLLPTPPTDLGEAKITDLLNTNRVSISVDSKYPQAIGISQIFYYTSFFGNSIWEILYNEIIDSPFFTSDYPVAIEMTKDPRIPNKIIPLSPNLAIRIVPDPNFVREKPDFTFSRFAYRNKSLKRKEVITINKLIVQCAESLVFYRDHHDWVYKFVARNSKFRIEPYTTKMQTNNGTLMIFTPRIGEKGTASKD
ncbi:MAG: DUF4238 domain-containing protein [Planctomycetota bacterium]